MAVRAKVTCDNVTATSVQFSAATLDPNQENNQFTNVKLNGELKLVLSTPDAQPQFTKGNKYHVVVTPAE